MTWRCRLVLFDLDGTLVDSAPDLSAALCHALTELGLPAHDTAAVRPMIGEGQRILVERAIRRSGGDLSLLEEVLIRFRRYYSEHLIVETALYPGVRETLAALSPRLPLAVATNKPGNWARRIIAGFGLMPHFRWVLGEDDVGARKPDPRLLLSLCARAAVDPADTLMVGDSAIDQAAAAAAGVRLALCTYGFGDAETLAAAKDSQLERENGAATKPYLIDTFAELLPLLLRD